MSLIRLYCRPALSFLFVMVFGIAVAQNKPAVNSIPSPWLTVEPKPVVYPVSTQVNSVRNWQPLVPIKSVQEVITSDVLFVQQTTEYSDGFGRPVQTVVREASPLMQDQVSLFTYDLWGRESIKYLSYVAGINGNFKNSPFTQQESFMQTKFPGESVFYTKTEYEPSSLNRIAKTSAPGNSWAGSGRGISMSYEIAQANEACMWNIEAGEGVLPTFKGYYAAGELYRDITANEQGMRTVEYKDKKGQVVLKKQEIAAGTPAVTVHEGWLCTYYIYDILGQLRFVMPPLAIEAFKDAGWSLTGQEDNVKELCFQYGYDSRRRMNAKKTPGADWMYMIYDKRDRLVFVQDGNMRPKQQWMTTIYDDLDRPVQTGILTGATRSGLENHAENPPAANAGGTITSYDGKTAGLPDILYINSHDGRPTYEASSSIVFEPGMVGTGNFVATIVAGSEKAFNSRQETFMNLVNPLPNGVNSYIPLTFTYYDDYSWTAKRLNTEHNNKLGKGNNVWGDPLPTATMELVTGLVTGIRVRVLEDVSDLTKGIWLESANFYDAKVV